MLILQKILVFLRLDIFYGSTATLNHPSSVSHLNIDAVLDNRGDEIYWKNILLHFFACKIRFFILFVNS